MKNVLLIGDFRDCANYGAIATTEVLIELILKRIDLDHFKTIEYRSFLNRTPNQGWKLGAEEFLEEKLYDLSNEKFKKGIKRILYKLHLLDGINKVRMKKRNKVNVNSSFVYHVPHKINDYERMVSKVLNGDCLSYEYELIKWADIVLINAEGSIVRGTDERGIYRLGGLYSLFISYLAKIGMGKECYIINHTVDPHNRDIQEMIKKIYPLLDGIYLREPLSMEILYSWGVNHITYAPDALFTYVPSSDWLPSEKLKKEIDFTKPYICIGDSSGIFASGIKIMWDVKKVYSDLIRELKKICPQIIFIDGFTGTNLDIEAVIKENKIGKVSLINSTYHDLYQIFAKSQIFISGRWHTSILALRAGTPILLWGSDSHKTEALYKMVDYPYRFFDINTLPIHIDELVYEAQKIIKQQPEKYKKFLNEVTIDAYKNVEML